MNNTEHIKKQVVDLRIRGTFKELFERDIDLKKKELYFTPEQLGASKQSTIDTLVQGMYKYYSKEQEKKYGVIAFILANES